MELSNTGSESIPNSQTKLYGVFGNPVAHSFSPMMHNVCFKHFQINAVYLAFEIQKGGLSLAFEAIRSLGFRGVNITVPFKEEAVGLVDEIPEDLDRGIDAINTIICRDHKLYGYNTDMAGFLVALKSDLNFDPRGKQIFLIGAGGSARAAAFALGFAEAKKIWVYNRTLDRGLGMVDHVQQYFPETEFEAVSDLGFLKNEKVHLVVNATSCGMQPQDPEPVDLKLFTGQPAVFDVIYAPLETRFLKSAASLDLKHANGLGMLAAQGALAFGLWTEKKEGVQERMLETLKKCF